MAYGESSGGGLCPASGFFSVIYREVPAKTAGRSVMSANGAIADSIPHNFAVTLKRKVRG